MNPDQVNHATVGSNRLGERFASARIVAKTVLLLLMASACVYLVVRGGAFFERHLETDPTALLPTEQQPDPETRAQVALARKMARAVLAHVPERVGAGDPARRMEAFEEAARDSGLFLEVIPLDGEAWIVELLHRVGEMRMPLLFPTWLERRRAAFEAGGTGDEDFEAFVVREAVDGLNHFLDRPDAPFWDEWLPHDPLLLLPSAVESPAFGEGSAGAGGAGVMWLWLEPKVFEAPYRDAVARFMEVQNEENQIEYTGAHAFAVASEAFIRREIRFLAVAGAFVLGLIVVVFLRRPGNALVVGSNIVLSFSGSVLLAVFVFETLHLVSFLFALLFGGLAADYTLHVLLKKETLGLSNFRQTLRAIRRPWIGIGLTTILGFLTLAWLGLPTLRQVGFLVAGGIALSLAFNYLYFTLRDDLGDDSVQPVSRFLYWRFPPVLAKIVPAAGILLVILGAFQIPGVQLEEDIDALRPPLPGLMERDLRIRRAVGVGGHQHGFLSAGEDWDAAVQSLRQASGDTFWHLADLLPTAREFRVARVFLQENPRWEARFMEALDEAELRANAFAPFTEAFRAYRARLPGQSLPDLLAAVETALQGPARILLTQESDAFHLVSIANREPPPDAIPARMAPLDYGGSISAVLTQYRRQSIGTIAGALIVLAIAPLVVFPWKLGSSVTAMTAGALICGLSLLLLAGNTLSLFHFAGLLVGTCLAMDYLFFAAAARPGEGPASIRLAAFSTFAVAGILATSAIPAVAAISLAIAATVGSGYLAAESYLARRDAQSS